MIRSLVAQRSEKSPTVVVHLAEPLVSHDLLISSVVTVDPGMKVTEYNDPN